MDFDTVGKSRAQVMEELRQKGIGTQVHYIPVNSQPYHVRKYGEYSAKDYPVTESYYNKCLSIPLFPAMSDGDVEYVIRAISVL
jgi:dTDP-4-amino-4,6-dideoxygalactose transaminase